MLLHLLHIFAIMHVYIHAVDIVVRVYLAKTFLTNIYMDILLKLNVLTYSW